MGGVGIEPTSEGRESKEKNTRGMGIEPTTSRLGRRMNKLNKKTSEAVGARSHNLIAKTPSLMNLIKKIK